MLLVPSSCRADEAVTPKSEEMCSSFEAKGVGWFNQDNPSYQWRKADKSIRQTPRDSALPDVSSSRSVIGGPSGRSAAIRADHLAGSRLCAF